MSYASYRVNRPVVVAQEIDGEVVAINLRTGNYYSLMGSGPDVWAMLEDTANREEIVAGLAARYQAAGPDIEAAVEELLSKLEIEGLIVPAGASNDDHRPRPVRERAQFEPPVFEKFDDMQDLILLDPVHEVDEESGWPHRSGQPETTE